ncbi:hypothetical protein ALT1644_20111 [Alteromonas macleodii]
MVTQHSSVTTPAGIRTEATLRKEIIVVATAAAARKSSQACTNDRNKNARSL